ncbi:hypothetical protein [Microbacterium sp. 1.5R]|uniref:hypothetical protein n=1 Tax=Microbacterium sp. 1.5R TaxID=1916917 RepID=UPI0011AAB5F2|nr:hypothetical protein [Microbacterium sp. 1.5R]
MATVEPPDFDAILRQEEERERNARMTARFAPLWAAGEAALRADVGLVIELAEEARRAAELRQDREARRERARHASALGVAARAARKAERDAAQG